MFIDSRAKPEEEAEEEAAAASERYRTQWEELMRRALRLQEAMKGLALQLVLPNRQVVVPSTAPCAGGA